MTFKPPSSSTCKFTDFAHLYSAPLEPDRMSEMLPAGDSVSVIVPYQDPPATANTPAISQPSHFEVTRTTQCQRLSSAYYDMGTGISKLKYLCCLCNDSDDCDMYNNLLQCYCPSKDSEN